MTQRLNHYELSQAMYEQMAAFSMTVKEHSSLPKDLLHLVDARVSMLNGCAFCLDMHVKEAKIDGERELRLYHLAVWRESDLFSAKEKAALEWAEAVTLLANAPVSEAIYQSVRQELSEQELSDLSFSVAAINSWNRLAAPSAMVPGSADALFGLDRAGL